jgi:arginyl-tRNA synthetase
MTYNLFKTLREEVLSAVQHVAQQEGWDIAVLPLHAVTVELPRDASHGDAATNAAMVLAKPAQMNPRLLAEKLTAALQNLPYLQGIDIAGAGFINFRFAPALWQAVIPAIAEEGLHFGDSTLGKGQRVNVEFVSANPTGPMHVGHARGAVFGDALCTLLTKAGFTVTREYYINDAGAQVDTLARSVHLRYREALGEAIGDMPEGMYPGEYLIAAGQALVARDGAKWQGKPEAQWLPEIRLFATDAMMQMIRDDLAMLGIYHDVFTSERELATSGKVEEALQLLDAKGLIYQGVLEAPKGKELEDWEARPQTLFKSTDFGDDCDRALKKSDGSWTYFAPDIALHLDKIRRGYTALVNVWGADHGGYVKRMDAAVKALSNGSVPMSVKLIQLVKFLRGGQPAKMSKRAGTFVTAREVVEEVGKDAFRFIMLTRKNDAPLDFDFEKVVEQSRENPVFYVQYAYARCRSIIRNIGLQSPQIAALAESEAATLPAALQHEAEIQLLQRMALWPVVVEQAAVAYEPHRVAFYLADLAAALHSFWTLGNENEHLRFIVADEKLSAARLVLVQSIATVIASGLDLLGVEPVEEMR